MKTLTLVSLFLSLITPVGASADLITTGTFTKWYGDVGDPAIWETFVNEVQVPNNLPDYNGFPQGELELGPPYPQSVTLENRGVGQTTFNTATVLEFVGTQQPNPRLLSDEFLLGTISITNGIFFFQASADIHVSTASDVPGFDDLHNYSTLRYIVTPNGGTDEENADYVYFAQHPELGEVRVYEAVSAYPNTGSIELWGRVGSLDLTAFRNPTGGVFVQPLPEPTVDVLSASGLALLGVARLARARRVRED